MNEAMYLHLLIHLHIQRSKSYLKQKHKKYWYGKFDQGCRLYRSRLYQHIKLCMASRNLTHTANLLAYICTLCEQLFCTLVISTFRVFQIALKGEGSQKLCWGVCRVVGTIGGVILTTQTLLKAKNSFL